MIPRPYRELAVAVGAMLVGAAAGNLLLGAPRDESVLLTSRRAIGLTFVARGLDSPVDLVSAPGERDRLYVVEQPGRIRVLEDGVVRSEPFLDIRRRVSRKGEQGLLILAFHPDYSRTRRFIVHYTDVRGDTRLVEYRSDGERALPRTA